MIRDVTRKKLIIWFQGEMMIAIDLTCFGKEEIINENIVSGIGTWVSEILDFIVANNKQKEYILVVNFYAVKYLDKRFPGFRIVSLGGIISRIIFAISGKSTETYLKNCGVNTKIVDSLENVDKIWFPFAIPEIVYSTKKKTIMTVHDFMKCHTDEEYQAYREMLHLATQVVTISSYVYEQLISKFPEFLEKKIPIIPNSISVKFDEVEVCDEIKKPFILNINRFEKHKNPDTLLKAYNLYIHEMQGEAELVFVGFGKESYIEELKKYAYKNGIDNKVHFMWKLEAAKKNWLLLNADLFVSPSVNEGMGRTPVEAMQCGIPVLTTKETALYEATLGLAEYCDNPFDEFEMAKRIGKILEHEKDEVKLQNISSKVTKEYSVENIWRKYQKIIDNI